METDETPDEFKIRRMRCALADFFCEIEAAKECSIELRVEAMIQFAAAGVSAMPGDRPGNLKHSVESFVATLQYLMPDVGVEFETSARRARQKQASGVH